MNKPAFDKILLAIDAGLAAKAAVGAIAHLAAPTGAQVVVLHVGTSEKGARDGERDEETLIEAHLLVDEVVADLVAAGVNASGEVVKVADGKVGQAIERAAEAHGANLVAVGSRGLSDVAGLFETSVSHRLVADLDCPILVAGAGSDPARPLRRILLAVSSEAESDRLADLAISIAKAARASILVLHVLAHPVASEYFSYIEPEEEAKAVVDSTVERIRAAGVEGAGKIKGSILPVADEIAETVLLWDADLVIAGSRRHRDLAALFVGATEHELIRSTHRPVLIAARSVR